MIVPGNEPFDPFLNSIELVKIAFSPIQSNLKKTAKCLEHRFSNNGKLIGNNDSSSEVKLSKNVIRCKVESMIVKCDQNEKGMKVPIDFLVGMFSIISVDKEYDGSNNDIRFLDKNVNLSKEVLNEKCGNGNAGKEDEGLSTNSLPFPMHYLINGFSQVLLVPFKAGKKQEKKRNFKDVLICDDSVLKQEGKSRVVGEIRQKEMDSMKGKELLFKYFIGSWFDQLSQNFPKLDATVEESQCKKASNASEYLRVLTAMLEGNRVNANGFDRNLKFARVGGVRSSIAGEVPSLKGARDDGLSSNVFEEENEGGSPESSIQFTSSNVTAASGQHGQSILKSALAGGLSCALSTLMMHPVDTIKTRVQATTLTLSDVLVKIPEFGARGLYKGSVPAVIGQFIGHALRTGMCEASRLLLINIVPTLPDIQVQSITSLSSTFVGTAVRVPTEVLKQRLQAGLFDDMREAFIGTWKNDGLGGFFRGTGATFFREIPFYVAGAGLYNESKKAVRKLLGRELQPWETVVVGAISGGLIAISTTPFDVIKTRMMTAQGHHVTASMVALSILHHDGPLGLFKGAVPRFFWIAPLGAMNFAGYELAKKAMDKIW